MMMMMRVLPLESGREGQINYLQRREIARRDLILRLTNCAQTLKLKFSCQSWPILIRIIYPNRNSSENTTTRKGNQKIFTIIHSLIRLV